MKDDFDFDAPVVRQAPMQWVCPRHGAYAYDKQAWHTERFTCSACIAEGKPIKAAWERSWAIYSAWVHCGVPPRFRNRRFANFRPHSAQARQALDAAKALATGDIQALALIGNVGTGKTHLTTSIVAEAVRNGESCRWANVPDLLRELRATFDKRSETTTEEIIARLERPQVLVLDEIGAATGSTWELATLSALIDERYRNGGAIVLTGNVTELASAIGERGADRIAEMGVCLAMTGESYRSKATDDPALQVDDDITEPPASLELIYSEQGVDRRERFEKKHVASGKASHQPLSH
jgi:DNA replication protein DnaC